MKNLNSLIFLNNLKDMEMSPDFRQEEITEIVFLFPSHWKQF